jgi:hypothetical protein
MLYVLDWKDLMSDGSTAWCAMVLVTRDHLRITSGWPR